MVTFKSVELKPTDEQQKNWEVAQRINRETRADPNSPYAGKHITILGGQVVAIGDTLDEMAEELNALGEETSDSVGISASADYDRKIMICNFEADGDAP